MYSNTSYRNSHFIIHGFLFVLLIIGLNAGALAQTPAIGQPELTFYTNREYNAGIQNYAITQDTKGLILVANNRGLLTFDGEKWTRHEVPGKTKVRAVEVGNDGKIYIGSQNEFGYFNPLTNGDYEYKSLVHLIPDSLRGFDDVWNIYLMNESVVFASQQLKFIYANDMMEIISSNSLHGFTFLHRSEIVSDKKGHGLVKYSQDDWSTLYDLSSLNYSSITSIINYDDKNDLIATYQNGLWIINEYSKKQWAKTLSPIFNEHKINAFIRLSDGNYAIGTNTDGLYIVNRKGQPIHHFNKSNGLPNRTIVSIYEDTNGAIWLGMNNGIVKIDWHLPYSYINESINVQGTGYSGISIENEIYLGTNNGLFQIKNNDSGNHSINKLPQIEGLVYNIQRIENETVISGHFGLHQKKDKNILTISDQQGWWGVIESPHQGLAIAGNYDGLYRLKKTNGEWKLEGKYSGFNESSRVMQFDHNRTLWMTHGYKGVYAIKFDGEFETISDVKFYGHEKGFPSNVLINVFSIDDKLVFAAEKGIYELDVETDQFVINQRLDTIIGDTHVRYMKQNHFGDIYLITSDYTGVINQDKWGNLTLNSADFNLIHEKLNDDLENIFMGTDHVYFAANDGFIAYNPSKLDYPWNQSNVLIREFKLTLADSSIYSEGVAGPPAKDIIIPYHENSISFSFAAPNFLPGPTEYQYHLVGFDHEWSGWNPSNIKEYTYLREGQYTFQVKAKNAFGQISQPTKVSFTINPPWYRHPFALGIYFVGFTGLFGIGLTLYRRKHKKEKRELITSQRQEMAVKDKEISELSIRTQKEITDLKNEKLQSEIRFKKQELASSTLHLIDKNDFISQIKTGINEALKDNADGKKINQRLKRIIKQIDKNIQSDENWSQFEIHFDAVHDNFLKSLKSKFETLTPQDVKLSAYLRMNLSTKEIANLMKISVRGVEIARYRLRKKLNLDQKENLVDFMMRQ